MFIRPPSLGTPANRIRVDVWNRGTGNYGASSWGSPPSISLDKNYDAGEFATSGEDGLKVSCAHEIGHGVGIDGDYDATPHTSSNIMWWQWMANKNELYKADADKYD